MVQQEALSRFSTAFKTWFTQDLPVKQWLNDAYAKYNVRGKNGNCFYLPPTWIRRRPHIRPYGFVGTSVIEHFYFIKVKLL